MEDVTISKDEVTKMAQEALPGLLKETFKSDWSNPLKDALDEILKSDELKEHLRKLIMEVYEEVSKEVDFKIFVKEAVVRQVIDQLQK